MHLVSRSDIASLAGVSRSALTQAVAGRLRSACVGKGRGLKIDLEHSVAQAYIDEKRRQKKPDVQQTAAQGTAAPANQAPTSNGAMSLVNDTGEVINLDELTVRDIAMKYGGMAEFAPYVKALKDIADYKNKEQAHLIKRGELIERATTAATLFMLLDAAFKRLVSEMPDAVMMQLVPLIKSGGEDSERDGKQLLVDAVSKILKNCKKEVRKKLKSLDKGGQDERQ